jgi:glycosyltransferase involved in cell wall biosynthesis
MTSPFFTIITATLNAAATLPRLLESLAAQTCRDFELIIQDGASSDDTVVVAEKWRERLPALSLESEPDTGIYDAWNKTLPRIRGEWTLFLGADDFLADASALEQAREMLEKAPETADYATSPVALVKAGNWADRRAADILPPSGNILRDMPQGMPLPHQGLFHRKRLFTWRRFDSTLRIVGDYDFLCRTAAEGVIVRLNRPLVSMALGGISGSPTAMWTRERESLRVSRRYFPGAVPHVILKRLALAGLFRILTRIAGEKAALGLADAWRALRGKPRIWTSDMPRIWTDRP